jgi:hypothetical protein
MIINMSWIGYNFEEIQDCQNHNFEMKLVVLNYRVLTTSFDYLIFLLLDLETS